jgi:dihydroflavonol-4-reductase
MDDRIYLVTGASGYVGSHMVRLLLKEGKKVRVFVRQKAKLSSEFLNLVEIFEGRLELRESVAAAVSGVYGIYHIGAVYREAKHPEDYFFKVNSEGTRNVFETAVEQGVKRIIYCSTGGVLGDIVNPPGNDKTPYAPGDMYQRSKVEAEKIALSFFKSGKINGLIIRPAMVYGPGDTRHQKLFKMVARGKFVYVGDGLKDVHFINVEDLVRAFKLGMEKEDINSEIYSIAGRHPTKLKYAVEIIADNLKVKRPWIHIPVKPMQMAGTICEIICKPFGIEPPLYKRRVDFFTKNRNFDVEKPKRELGFESKMDVKEEICYVADWYKSNGWL